MTSYTVYIILMLRTYTIPKKGFVNMSNTNDFDMNLNILQRYRGKGGDITLPNNVRIIAHSVFKDNLKLTSVTIPKNVQKVGDYAFYKCTNLEAVYISDVFL